MHLLAHAGNDICVPWVVLWSTAKERAWGTPVHVPYVHFQLSRQWSTYACVGYSCGICTHPDM